MTIRPVDFLILLVLGIAWGSSFLFIKIAVVEIPPVTLAGMRVLVGAVILAILAKAQHQRIPPLGRVWLLFLIVGLLGNIVPFALIGWAELLIDSALAAILMATGPLFTVVLAHWFTAEDRLSRNKVLGIALGFSGVAVLVGPNVLTGASGDLLATAAVTGAALSYALTNILAHRIHGSPALITGACVLFCAGLWSIPTSLLLEGPWPLSPSGPALFGFLWLSLISTAAGQLMYFRLIRSTGPSFVAFVNYLVPAMGVVLGAVVLGERIGMTELLALALILLGIAATAGRLATLGRYLAGRAGG